jgi:uncharacterized protein YifE (UPF0438 family)
MTTNTNYKAGAVPLQEVKQQVSPCIECEKNSPEMFHVVCPTMHNKYEFCENFREFYDARKKANPNMISKQPCKHMMECMQLCEENGYNASCKQYEPGSSEPGSEREEKFKKTVSGQQETVEKAAEGGIELTEAKAGR